MKLLKSAKKYWIDELFAILVILFGILYFVVYMTPGKSAWYHNSFHDIKAAISKHL